MKLLGDFMIVKGSLSRNYVKSFTFLVDHFHVIEEVFEMHGVGL